MFKRVLKTSLSLVKRAKKLPVKKFTFSAVPAFATGYAWKYTKNDLFAGILRRTFYLSRCFFLNIYFTIYRTVGEWGGYIFNSSLRLSPASQTLRYQLQKQCKEITSAHLHSQQQESSQESLVSEHKLLTTQQRTFKYFDQKYRTAIC